MSFDIIILRPSNVDAEDLSAVENLSDIGALDSVNATLDSIFPGCAQGTYSAREFYSVESSQSGDPVSSVHLTLRFGSKWSEAVNEEFLALLSTLCQQLQSHAFAVSDNSRVAAFC